MVVFTVDPEGAGKKTKTTSEPLIGNLYVNEVAGEKARGRRTARRKKPFARLNQIVQSRKDFCINVHKSSCFPIFRCQSACCSRGRSR
ncbi:hypothetical protein PSAC2689_100072 [Paraburkholderia sacchari]